MGEINSTGHHLRRMFLARWFLCQEKNKINQMNPICYLCGKYIIKKTPTDDHVISRQFIKRNQPKVKGFDYGGKLLTHHDCNTQFDPEKMCSKALQVLGAININQIYTNSKNPTISMQSFKKKELSSFSKEDFEFFGLIDTTDNNYKDWVHNLDFFKDKKKIIPLEKPLNIVTSVLVKNVAALLVKRFKASPKSYWNVLCMPYQVPGSFDLDSIFGNTKPFEIGVKVWIKRLDNNSDYIACYRNQKVSLIIIFSFSPQDEKYSKYCTVTFQDAEKLLFKSPRLMDLVNYNWLKNRSA